MNITQYEKLKKHLSDADTGPFTLNEFSFYMKEDDRYIQIPVLNENDLLKPVTFICGLKTLVHQSWMTLNPSMRLSCRLNRLTINGKDSVIMCMIKKIR